MNSFEYRMFLSRNGNSIREINELYSEKKNASPGHNGSIVPERTILRCTPEGCDVEILDPNGVGQGRDFGVGADCDSLANVSNLRNRVYKKTDKEQNCCGQGWQSSGGYPYIENNLTIGTFELSGDSFSVDTGQDYANALEAMKSDKLFQQYSLDE